MTSSTPPLTTIETTMNPAVGMTGSAVTLPLRGLAATLAVGLAFTAAVVGLYLVKSALGINVFAWHSPLHGLFYHFVR
jgi:hypothetical protein